MIDSILAIGVNEDVDISQPHYPSRSINSSKAAESAVYKSNVMRLAYLNATNMEPGARLTNQDIQRSIDMIGGNVGSKAQILLLLDNADNYVRMNTTNYHKQTMAQYPEAFFPPLSKRLQYKGDPSAPKVPEGAPEGSTKSGKTMEKEGTIFEIWVYPNGEEWAYPTGGSK